MKKMKILWTVNLIPTDAAKALGIKNDVLGGWVESMAGQLKEYDDAELAICCKTDNGEVFDVTADGIRYFSLSYKDGNLAEQCLSAVEKFGPDLIHIEGTEFIHAREMLFIAKKKNIPAVVSLQGILNGQYNYQCGQLPLDDMMFSRSLTDMLAAWLLHFRKTRWYAPRMKPEREIIENADYILGRTTWDRAHSYAINPRAEYFSCARVLRPPFYSANWDIGRIERHSIYVGNGYYALKGLHFLVRALPLLKREYPDVKVYVAGHEPFTENDRRSFLKKGYGSYLKKLIDDLGVAENIEFTGTLRADGVVGMLEKVNVYVLTSVAENSPNTLGEAMMTGTPCVASYVGGVPDMAADGEEALFYRNDDPELLAWNIKRVFDDDALALRLSENGRKRARATHDAAGNARRLYSVYRKILKIPDGE